MDSPIRSMLLLTSERRSRLVSPSGRSSVASETMSTFTSPSSILAEAGSDRLTRRSSRSAEAAIESLASSAPSQVLAYLEAETEAQGEWTLLHGLEHTLNGGREFILYGCHSAMGNGNTAATTTTGAVRQFAAMYRDWIVYQVDVDSPAPYRVRLWVPPSGPRFPAWIRLAHKGVKPFLRSYKPRVVGQQGAGQATGGAAVVTTAVEVTIEEVDARLAHSARIAAAEPIGEAPMPAERSRRSEDAGAVSPRFAQRGFLQRRGGQLSGEEGFSWPFNLD